jgi:hypothetical protein
VITNRFGIHWQRAHQDNNRDFEFIQRTMPASIKLFGSEWGDRHFCHDLLKFAPLDCIFLARDHPLSEQKEDMWRDPVGTGRRHAEEWNEKIHRSRFWLPVERTYFLGINEPDAVSGDRAAIDAYTVAFLDGLRMHGLKGGAFNFSTGHPRTKNGTNAPDDRKDYAFFEASHQAIVRGRHIAVQHIYGSAEQPLVPGHFDALRDCPWTDITWVIGECGIDQHVTTGGEHVGYLGALNPPQSYPQWIEKLIRGTNDSRIHSWMPFTYDFHKPWASFDAREVNEAFAAWGWKGLDIAPSHTVHLPLVTAPVSHEDLFERSMTFLRKWEGGFQNNPEDHGNWTGGRKGVGELKGTKFGISAASYPDLDIVNLTQEQADAIYRRDYWQRSGADKLQWPACLLIFDTAVLHGVGTALNWQKEVGTDAFVLAAKRLRRYTQLDNWSVFGAGWTNRVAALLEEIGRNI